jgi:hypothetical protein
MTASNFDDTPHPDAVAICTAAITSALDPQDAGAEHYAHQYGDALVCVRHRDDGSRRYTTVEVVVEKRTAKASKRKRTVRPSAARADDAPRC